MSSWEHLSEQTQDIYTTLATQDEKAISKIKSRHLRKAIRESMYVGYDSGSPYEWLKFEYDRRNKLLMAKLTVVTIILGVIAGLSGFIG